MKFRLGIWKKYIDGEALEQVVQRTCGCSIPESIQGQFGWGPTQPDLVQGVPAHGRGTETR